MSAIPYNARATHLSPPLGFQWTWYEADGGYYEATGTCPICQCAMTTDPFEFGQHTIVKGGFMGRRKDPGPAAYHTLCTCETLHTGRPASEPSGCGAFLALAAPQQGGSTP
ncbi:hypothetical protein OG250_33080 [Streptomyces sp. NBC_00487]|uniref:hypothetical protein n=1 Tax=unclassified Streptomyces TaxID=2593676 RepID=UPI002E191AC6|nr:MULTISPECIES: hypothetical protein [unclassified Streptomyces]